MPAGPAETLLRTDCKAPPCSLLTVWYQYDSFAIVRLVFGNWPYFLPPLPAGVCSLQAARGERKPC